MAFFQRSYVNEPNCVDAVKD